MKRRRVVTTPDADDDAERIDKWWTQNRSAAPNLFVEELADAFALLAIEAGVGVRCANRVFPACAGIYFVQRDTTSTSFIAMSLWWS